jgi:uncharacterized protein YndB with AHSA1/START domain
VSRPVRFEVPVETAFDYLVDPHHRPEWQSSLARVDDVDGEPRVGQTWTDVTVPRIRPAMRTTALRRPHTWSEVGTWNGVSAELTLDFRALGAAACEVECHFTIRVLGPVGRLATLVSAPAVRSDLRRAARLLVARA